MFITDERPKSFAALGHVKEIASGWDHGKDYLDDSPAKVIKWDLESAFRFAAFLGWTRMIHCHYGSREAFIHLEVDAIFCLLICVSFPCPLGSPFAIDNLGSKAGRSGNGRPCSWVSPSGGRGFHYLVR